MGILLTTAHWRRATNRLWDLRPVRERPLSHEDAIAILDVACRTLRDLVTDTEFDADLQKVAELSRQAEDTPRAGTKEFERFFRELKAAELALLLQSRVKMDAAGDLIHEIDTVIKSVEETEFDSSKFKAQVEYVTKLACDYWRNESHENERAERTQVIWRATKGVALVGIDSSAAAAGQSIGSFLGLLIAAGPASISIAWGWALLQDSLKHYW